MFNTTQKDNWPEKDTPDIRRAFDTARDPHIAAQIAQLEHTQAQQRAEQEQRGSTMVKNHAPMPHPTPPRSTGHHVDKQSFDARWQEEQRIHAPLQPSPSQPEQSSTITNPFNRSAIMADQTQQPQTNASTKGRPPVDTIRKNGISLKIWENQNSKGEIYHNISLEKNYRTPDGQYRTAKSLNQNDLKILQELIPQAEQAIQHRQEQSRNHAQQQAQHDAPQPAPQYQEQPQQQPPQQQQPTLTQAELAHAHEQAMQHGQIPEQQHTRTMTHER